MSIATDTRTYTVGFISAGFGWFVRLCMAALFQFNQYRIRFTQLPAQVLISARGQKRPLAFFLFLFLLLPFGSPHAFSIGDRVEATQNLNVRACPLLACAFSDPAQPTVPAGTAGTIVNGSYSGDGYTWWYINWDNSPTGYSVENYLALLPGGFILNTPTTSCSGTNSEIRLSWGSSAGATRYDVYRNSSFYANVLTSLTFDNTANVAAGNNYSYFIRASNTTGTTDSNTVSVIAPTCVNPPEISVGPSSLNFGSVQVGTCSSSSFAIQHVVDAGAASGSVSASTNPPFAITSNSSFSVSGGAGVNVGVQFCPSSEGVFSGSASINTSAITNISTVGLSGTGFIPAPTTGAIQVNATLDGSAWSGTVNYGLSGPQTISGTTAPADFQDRPQGNYTLAYSSGGPAGATLSSISPSSSQALSGGSSITFTLNFVSPAVSASWITPPPSTVTSGEDFTVDFSTTGNLDHVNIHWDPADPGTPLNPAGNIDPSCVETEVSCSTDTPTSSPRVLTAPVVTAPAVVKYAVHVSKNGNDVFSNIFSVTVNPPSLAPPVISGPGTTSDTGFVVADLAPTFTWTAASGATSYGIYISMEPYGSGNIIYQNSSLIGPSFTLPNGSLVSGTKYRWNMTSFTGGVESGVSASTLYFQTPSTALGNPELESAILTFKARVLSRIDNDIDRIAIAFTDARELRRNIFWSDIFSPALDAAYAIKGALLAIKSVTAFRSEDVINWLGTTIDGAQGAYDVWSALTSVASIMQGADNLTLAITGPEYNGIVTSVLNKAEVAYCIPCTDAAIRQAQYKTILVSQFLGTNIPQESPIWISLKNSDVNRSHKDRLYGAAAAKIYANNVLNDLLGQIQGSVIDASTATALVNFINQRSGEIVSSSAQHTNVTYPVYLTGSNGLIQAEANYSLGLVATFDAWRAQVLSQYAEDLDITYTMRYKELRNTLVKLTADQLLTKGTELVNFNLSVDAVVAGQVGTNIVMKDAVLLGLDIGLDVAASSDKELTFLSTTRKQVDMIPQQMLDAMPDELAKVLMMVDDIDSHTRRNVDTSIVVSGVNPNTLVGATTPQTIEVRGAGFSGQAVLRFSDGVTTYDRIPSYVNSEKLIYDITVGTSAAEWSVTVIDSGIESNAFSFSVIAPVADVNSPPPPTGLVVTPLSWTDTTLYYLDWINPSDLSGIVRVWWKTGSAPAASDDGIAFDLPLFKPLPFVALNDGPTNVYIWLEDGAGNKDYNNYSYGTAYHDATSPLVTIVNPSVGNTYLAETSSVVLSGTATDNFSGLATMSWSNDQGGSGSIPISSNWTTPAITLYEGENVISVTATDNSGMSYADVITVTYPGSSHALTIANEPKGNINPIQSSGQVNISVAANDSFGHQLSYLWSAACTGSILDGVFSTTNNSMTVWTAPVNQTGVERDCSISVVIDDGNGLAIVRSYIQRVASEGHQISFSTFPNSSSNPVASQGNVALNAAANDSFGHVVSYTWSVDCPGLVSNGNLSDAAIQNPIWSAPANTTGSQQNCTISVDVSDGVGLSGTASYIQAVDSVVLGEVSVTLQPGPVEGKDIWTTSTYSYAPGGGGPGGGLDNDELRIGGWSDTYLTLMEFDLVGMPQLAISARLWLYCYSSNSSSVTSMYLDRIIEPWDWDRADRLWWADRPATSQWSAGTIPAPVVGAWYEVDITDLYNAWQDGTNINYGFQFRPSSTSNKFNFFYSSDYDVDSSLRPKLIVTYQQQDSDGDGLLDSFEAAIGTDPLLTDTDGDGISDYDEVAYDNDSSSYTPGLDLNPLSVDTDGDGVSDGLEVALATDPLNPGSVPFLADGDVNLDGQVNVADVLLGIQAINGSVTLTEEQRLHADVAPLVSESPVPDGQYNLGDLLVIQRKVLGQVAF